MFARALVLIALMMTAAWPVRAAERMFSPAEVRADFIDLVHHEYRIVGAGLVDSLNDASRHRSHVRTAMPPDFGFIMNAAQTHTNEFPAESSGDRLAQ